MTIEYIMGWVVVIALVFLLLSALIQLIEEWRIERESKSRK